ncbi:MAG: hypothetical protein ACLFPA_12705, partial [Dichotomicrobium sp.]
MFHYENLFPMFRDADGSGAGAGAGEGEGGGEAAGTSLTKAAKEADAGDKGGQDGKTAKQDGAGDAGDKNADAGGKSADPGDKSADKGGEGGAEVYWPEGLPESLAGYKGENDRETIDKLTAALKDQPAAPEKPEGYQLDLPKEFTDKYGDLSEDEVLPIWREIAHKQGMSNAQFNGAIAELYQQLNDKGILQEPIDPQAEMAKLAPKGADPVQGKAQAAQRIRAVSDQIEGLVSRGVLSRVEGNIATSLAADAAGVMTLEKLLARGGEHGAQGGGR